MTLIPQELYLCSTVSSGRKPRQELWTTSCGCQSKNILLNSVTVKASRRICTCPSYPALWTQMSVDMEFYTYSFLLWQKSPTRARVALFFFKVSASQTMTPTVRRITLDEWSACRIDLYLKTLNNPKRQTSMSTISASEWPQNLALPDRLATGCGSTPVFSTLNSFLKFCL